MGKLGPLTYPVRNHDGLIFRRHINQMRRTSSDIELKKPLHPTPVVILKQIQSNAVNTYAPQKTPEGVKVLSSPSMKSSLRIAPKHTDVCHKSISPKSIGLEPTPRKPDTPVVSFFKRCKKYPDDIQSEMDKHPVG